MKLPSLHEEMVIQRDLLFRKKEIATAPGLPDVIYICVCVFIYTHVSCILYAIYCALYMYAVYFLGIVYYLYCSIFAIHLLSTCNIYIHIHTEQYL